MLLSLRERVIAALCAEDAVGTPIYREERIALGLYEGERAEDAATELELAAGLLVRTLGRLPEGSGGATITYSPQSPFEASIDWMSAQALHELSHHLADAERSTGAR